jgi:type III restriction enzyme
LLKDLRLVGGYDLLYPKVRDFLREHLFEQPVDLDDPVILRNLSGPAVAKLLFDHFRAAINALTLRDSGSSRIEGHIRLRDTRPFRTEPRGFLPAKKSVFNRIVGEPMPTAWNWPSPPFSTARPMCRPSARTTSRSASSWTM